MHTANDAIGSSISKNALIPIPAARVPKVELNLQAALLTARRYLAPTNSWRETTARCALRAARKLASLAREVCWRAWPPAGFDEVKARCGGDKRPVVFLPSIGWSATLFQRPQHLARAFARRGHVTIYDCTGTRERIRGFRE